MKHLAIFTGDAIEKILSGEKTIEVRFSKAKIAPFGKIGAGDRVIMKQSGEELVGQFTVEKVISWDNFSSDDFQSLKKLYGKQIAADSCFWRQKQEAKYATLMFIRSSSRFLTPPTKFVKKDLRAWVVLD